MQTRKKLRLGGFNYADKTAIFFITINTWADREYFKNSCLAQIVFNEIIFRSTIANEMKLYACCVMPTHVHLLFSLCRNYPRSLSTWASSFKRYTSWQINAAHSIKPLWQKNYYDHIVRSGESLVAIAEYIVDNPVRSKLVSSRDGYEFCKINYGEIRSVL